MAPVVQIEKVVKSFGELCAVAGVSLEVNAGEVVGLIGPDGAGKTTTLRMIAGLMSPSAGVVRVFGRDLAEEARAPRVRLGYMPQQYSLYGDLTVQENLRFFAGMYGVAPRDLRAREERLLGIAKLQEFRNRPAGALSGGMYKKLALACALVHAPELLLLDEPTNGVDPISRRELWQFLDELVEGGVGVLVSTPYMDEAERCDRVGLLVDGTLVALASPQDLKTGFAATVFEVTTSTPLGTTKPLQDVPGVEEAYMVGRKIHVVTREGPDLRDHLERALRRAGANLVSLHLVAPSFEDIFMRLSRSARSGS